MAELAVGQKSVMRWGLLVDQFYGGLTTSATPCCIKDAKQAAKRTSKNMQNYENLMSINSVNQGSVVWKVFLKKKVLFCFCSPHEMVTVAKTLIE